MSDRVRIVLPQKPETETKHERFRRLGEKRAQRVLSCLVQPRLNLSASSYEYSEEEAGQVIAALRRGLDEAERRRQVMPEEIRKEWWQAIITVGATGSAIFAAGITFAWWVFL